MALAKANRARQSLGGAVRPCLSGLAGLLVVTFAGGCRSSPPAPAEDEPAPQARQDGSAVAAASGAACAHGSERACGAGEFCDEEPGLCGQGREPGVCRPRPAECAGGDGPVCGCDRRVYPSECAAHAAGVDVSVLGGCGEQVPGKIACGARYCDARASYCEIVVSDVLELPSTYTCRPLPQSCATPDGSARPPECSCFPPKTRCSDFCVAVDARGATSFRLTCVGGY